MTVEMEKMEVKGQKRKKAVRAQREVYLAGGPTTEQTWQKNAASSHCYWGGCLFSLRKQRRGFHDPLKSQAILPVHIVRVEKLTDLWNLSMEWMKECMHGWVGGRVCVCIRACMSVYVWTCACAFMFTLSYGYKSWMEGREREKPVCSTCGLDILGGKERNE